MDESELERVSAQVFQESFKVSKLSCFGCFYRCTTLYEIKDGDYVPLLEDKNGIFWVVGESIDDRVKMTKNTQKVLMCQVYKHIKSE